MLFNDTCGNMITTAQLFCLLHQDMKTKSVSVVDLMRLCQIFDFDLTRKQRVHAVV